MAKTIKGIKKSSFNPYFIGLPILIIYEVAGEIANKSGFNPYFIGLPILIVQTCIIKIIKKKVSILILLDYLFLLLRILEKW